MSSVLEPTRDVFGAGRRGVRHAGVRRANEKTVLTVVAFNSGASNAEISRLSGLAPQTVSAILVDLEQEGLIERGPVLRGRRGQPATPILLHENGGFSIGVEISWRHFDVVLINMHAKILQHHHEDHAYPDASSLFDRIGVVIEEFRHSLAQDQRSRLLDIGLAMPGSLTTDLDLLHAPPEQVVRWRQLDPVAELTQRSELKITQVNDGNAGCWAELIALAPPRPANIIFLMVSQLLLAGMVSDGTLWEGATGHAADLGSSLIHVDGGAPQLAHQVASLFALRARLVAAGFAEAEGPVAHWDMTAMAPHIEAWIGEAAQALAQVVHNASVIFEPPLVVLDTELGAAIGSQLAMRLQNEMGRFATRGFNPPRVVNGRHGRLSPAIGAAELPLYWRYF
ncbi:putative NBD/HSP70 family sugar kinase [Devosia subaequoris]|uniref:Putative NBD/HSP70 family sugar kinase n=1 Tax=Devosia subaequoris TaxID=395930 RepID=A0A7W6IPQ2_9HYPH|nr:ROK family transcriptional regulator [Devosia subaequoris]MBB4053047.1 putative NBD/HSP70 family sugar kinase [Devosia subaequoris]MCP1210464.1 ROK family transcriptional regulator [Devosia subaequoris]